MHTHKYKHTQKYMHTYMYRYKVFTEFYTSYKI